VELELNLGITLKIETEQNLRTANR